MSPIKVLCCPTAFKGTLGAREAADAMARGARKYAGRASVVVMPLSDGGPGLLDALLATPTERATGSGAGPVSRDEPNPFSVRVSGPLGDPAPARILGWGAEMVIESADAIGLHLVAGGPDPLRASTRGLGEALAAGLERLRGARRVVVGLGGSATVDGGTGMAKVLGYRFLDAAGRDLPDGGGALGELAAIEPGTPPRAEFLALADVGSPLCGPDGAAYRFAAQKGASPQEIERLELGLGRLAEVIERDLGVDVSRVAGAGAAGGLGAGCVAFLGASLRPGAAWVMERVDFDRHLAAADVVVTGEGAWDATSGLGKVTHEVLRRSRQAGKPVLLACGRVEGAVSGVGFVAVDGEGAQLDSDGLARLVATALRAHRHQLQGS